MAKLRIFALLALAALYLGNAAWLTYQGEASIGLIAGTAATGICFLVAFILVLSFAGGDVDYALSGKRREERAKKIDGQGSQE